MATDVFEKNQQHTDCLLKKWLMIQQIAKFEMLPTRTMLLTKMFSALLMLKKACSWQEHMQILRSRPWRVFEVLTLLDKFKMCSRL